jgi:hypothetical protein
MTEISHDAATGSAPPPVANVGRKMKGTKRVIVPKNQEV